MPIPVCVIKGTRFAGTPSGNSPISAVGWAPIGLKYRKAIALSCGCTRQVSRIISSPICFVLP